MEAGLLGVAKRCFQGEVSIGGSAGDGAAPLTGVEGAEMREAEAEAAEEDLGAGAGAGAGRKSSNGSEACAALRAGGGGLRSYCARN